MSTTAKVVSVVIYALLAISVIFGMLRVRTWAQATYGTVAAQQEWDEWRDEATQQSGDAADFQGPVERRAPKSARPPALVLMDDHFGVCLGFALLLSSVLYGTLVFMIAGATRSGTDD